MKLGKQVGLSTGHIVLDRDSALILPKGHSPQFSAHIRCGQMAAWIKMPLGMEVGLDPGDFVLYGDSSPLPKKGAESPQFSVHVYCGQTAGCIKMPLGMELGLSPGDFVLDGWGPRPLSKFSAHVYCGQMAGWIKIALGMEVSLPPQKGAEPLPNFRPMSIVAKRLDGSRWNLAWRWALVQASLC